MPNILSSLVEQQKLNKKHFFLVVTPNHKFQNYRVQVFQINQASFQVVPLHLGPIVSGMLLNFQNLCFYTQATIYNIQRQIHPQAF